MAEVLAKLKDGLPRNCNTADNDGVLVVVLLEALATGAKLDAGSYTESDYAPTNYSVGTPGDYPLDTHFGGIDTALGNLASTSHASSHSENQSDEVLVEALGSAEMTTGKLLAPDGSGGVGWVDAPSAPTNSSLTEVSDTVEVEFDKVAASGDVDWYEIWSSVGGTTDYCLIGIVPEADAGTPTKVVDATYAKKATIYYKIYAVRHGVYSSALSDNIALSNDASDVTGLDTVAQLDTFILSYVLPTERKFSYVQIKRHAHAVQGSLSEGSATQVYAGIANHYVYTILDADLTKWHQFWIYTVTAT